MVHCPGSTVGYKHCVIVTARGYAKCDDCNYEGFKDRYCYFCGEKPVTVLREAKADTAIRKGQLFAICNDCFPKYFNMFCDLKAKS